MKHTALTLLGCVAIVVGVAASDNPRKGASDPRTATASAPAAARPVSLLFDNLGEEPDVVYLIANSSVVFGPDSHGRSEEITFVGPVTVPKWPMKGYERRVLPDGRQQIDMELTQSELTGESYVLGGPVILGEHPDLRSLGTITERPAESTVTSDDNGQGPQGQGPAAPNAADMMSLANDQKDPQKDATAAKLPAAKMNVVRARSVEENTQKLTALFGRLNARTLVATDKKDTFVKVKPEVIQMLDSVARLRVSPNEVVPADFVVERKVLLTTAKGILYNETAVPVRGRIDSIPPVKFQGTPTGVNVFRGMELPVALLDKDGHVNGWFYSKAHMAYAVLPAAIERAYIKGTISLKSGDKTEDVTVSGPVEFHHLSTPEAGTTTEVEVMVLALRGRSDLLGGDIMLSESFSDRDLFSRGQVAWHGNDGNSAKLNLFVDLYSPSTKLMTHEPLSLTVDLKDCTSRGRLEKGLLNLPLLGGTGRLTTAASRTLYDETERPVIEVTKVDFAVAERGGM